MNRKSAWLISAGLTVLATPAFAQTAQSPTDTDKQTAQPTPGATEGAAVQDQARQQQPVDTGEIVVTATRRNQALSDVPMAVSAVTAQNLRNTGATDIRQLNQIAPSLLVSSTQSEAGGAVARIRGIGTVGDNPGLEGSVGVFIDGVYRSRTGIGLTELGAIDRIEVLRGPQGTLFGRNTSAGLISVITAKPRFQPEVTGQIDVGNYNFFRVQLGATGPITDTLAVRVDAVYSKRDGFLKDVVSGRDINDRNRGLIRGQLLYQPSDNFSFRLIADTSRVREECCGAAYLPVSDTVVSNGTITHPPSTIAGIMRGIGGIIEDDTYDRKTAITPGRNYRSDVNDWGISGEGVYDFGWGELTSITAYRFNRYTRGQDADFNNLDIVYRDDDGGAQNRFKTFSQELRLQGKAFGGHLDWLVGGYYANEKLRVLDNIAYGTDYSHFANCLVANKFAQLTGATTLVNTTNDTCFNPQVAAALLPFVGSSATALSAFARLGPFAAPIFTNSGFTNLSIALTGAPVSLTGTGLDDQYDQTSNNFAIFTHNIISITDSLKLTVGARYTHEKKSLNADLTDVGGSTCALFGGGIQALWPLLKPLQQLPCALPSVPGGHLTGSDSQSENKLSGTAVLSYKVTDRLLAYASYSRGYKAGGYNLDRTALARYLAFDSAPDHPVIPGAVRPDASFADLRFKPETNDAFEIGAKYHGSWIDVNVAVFHQLFRNFQLNTFNGINFFVENINSCKTSLNGLDTDNVQTIDSNGNALNTGACTGDTRAGVKNQGVELEVFARPMPDVSVNFGTTYANTKYRSNLVGADGRALTNSLFQLPGNNVSNAPEWTVTGSLSWTPRITDSGLRALFYIDARHTSSYNTGSDLDLEKMQQPFTVVNARVGLHGPSDTWALELWAQNLFKANYKQVAFDAFAQGSCTTRGAENGFCSPIPNKATQLYAAFLGEPRTFGLTLRGKLDFRRPPPPAYEPPPSPPPAPATQTCPDGTVIEATATCPAPPPPPPPAPAPERGL